MTATCLETTEQRKVYEKPRIVKQEKMTFPTDILASRFKTFVCRQCSSCHGCR